jgi:serine/threonine protein kinase
MASPITNKKALSPTVIAKLNKIAQEDVEEMMPKSALFRIGKKRLEALPKYDIKRTDFGKVLGKGHFCTVTEIRSVRMSALSEYGDNEDLSSSEEVGLSIMPTLQEGRALGTGSFVSPANCTKLVAKQLNRGLMGDKNEYFVGVRSLAVEAHFLAAVDHKHILKLKGISSDLLFETSSFIVLERLHGTLHNKLVEWSARMRKFGGVTSMVRKNMGEKKRIFSKERYEVALQVTSAVQYLHENNILFRDLKTENIGLDENDQVKLFDFGLCREVDPSQGKPYKLTGMIGSWFYMAPEVYYEKPYDESIDIFSLGIVMWQLVALDRLYPGVSSTQMLEADVMAKGMRPKVQPDWPESLKRMLTNMWSEDPEDRPTARNVSIMIKREIAAVAEEIDEKASNNAESSRPALGGFLRRRFTT